MSDRVREAVSVLMDGEADELAVRRLLTQDSAVALDTAETVRDSWSSFHRQRRVIQGADLRFEQWDVSQSVMAALADEPAYSQIQKRNHSGWLKPLSGFAVAASVAAIVVVSAPSWRQIEPSSTNTVAAVNTSTSETTNNIAPINATVQIKNTTAVTQAQSININNPRSVYLANGEQAVAPVLQFPQQFNGGIPVSLKTGGVESTHSYMYDNDTSPMAMPEGVILYLPTSQYDSGYILPAQNIPAQK